MGGSRRPSLLYRTLGPPLPSRGLAAIARSGFGWRRRVGKLTQGLCRVGVCSAPIADTQLSCADPSEQTLHHQTQSPHKAEHA